MYELIATPYLDRYLLIRPGADNGVTIPYRHYAALKEASVIGGPVPAWLTTAARRAWGINLEGRPTTGAVLVRSFSPLSLPRASYELNLGCNYDCEHCYLGLKRFEGLSWPEREKLLYAMRDAGVMWLQLTGGEPLVDRLFCEVYSLAYELGMMLDVLTNGSRLADRRILGLLTRCPPHRVTVSVYGATEETYDRLTRRPGSFRKFDKGLRAAVEARVPLDLTLIVTKTNAHEDGAMAAMGDQLGVPSRRFATISPTIYGGAESLAAQAPQLLEPRAPFTGCNAGRTFFHVDPFGKASICKVGREPHISLLDEGVDGLGRLAGIADRLLRRQGGCADCALTGSCGTCMVLVTQYRKAHAPLSSYCQHGQPKGPTP